ncbi:MAG: hypothetical protein IPP01_00035 [Saprospiraceae bacterium]|nr:hypothetical protein [Saprospiraceae bacterium]
MIILFVEARQIELKLTVMPVGLTISVTLENAPSNCHILLISDHSFQSLLCDHHIDQFLLLALLLILDLHLEMLDLHLLNILILHGLQKHGWDFDHELLPHQTEGAVL